MTWISAIPVGLVAAGWCLAPGMLLARAAGARGIALWGTAPLLSIGIIAATAVLGGRLGLAWAPWQVMTASVLLALTVLAARVLVPSALSLHGSRPGGPALTAEQQGAAPVGHRRTVLPGRGPDGRSGIALLAGMIVTVALGWLTAVLAFGQVDAISPTYDAVHHYSAVARILETGDGSSLTLGELTAPGRPGPYPAAWHDLVALVVQTSGASIPAASNLVALAVATIVWPLSCVLLARQMLGRRPAVFLVAPILATAFTSMPWLLMTWGVLWPNLLGLALAPAGLAAGVTLVGLTRESAIDRIGALLLSAIAVPALGLAHPNAVVSVLVLALSPLVCAAAVSAVRGFREHRAVPAVAALAGATGIVLAVIWFIAWSPFLASVRSFDWPATMGAREAVRGVLWNATNDRPELWVVSVLVLAGAVLACRDVRTGWLVPAHLTSAFLYVLAISREGALTTALTGAWYNDSYRLAAMLPITGVPLATIGVVGTVGVLVRAGTRLRGVEPPAQRLRFLTVAGVAVVSACLVLVSDGFRVGVHAFVVAGTYQREATWMLQPGQREFLVEAGRLLPPGADVAANPWTGNALLYPLTGRGVTFPHMAGRWTPDQQIVRDRLRDAADDPSVCPAVRSAGVGYAIDGPVSYWPWDARSQSFPGLTDLSQAPGFEPIISGGGSTLYRITACDAVPARSPAAQNDASGG